LHHGRPAPIIPIQLRGPSGWVSIWAYVDSGASFSIFAAASAERLGVPIARGRLTNVVVGDGSLIPTYVHRLPLRIGNLEVTAHIGFSPRLGVGFDLLGRQDLFERFDVTFSDSRQRILFKPVR
jgi:hypothetical protein